ncbi:MAG TPA: aspartate kinase, partial [Flavisolibacter sp.]|nr:aspartate kinase [Flavisolibacter sp.]
MQVLKFGGSSVANAMNMKKVSDIIKEESNKESLVVVVSALGGITDKLLQCGNLAGKGDPAYKELLQEVAQHHLETAKSLLPINNQSSLLSQIMQRCNEIEDICNGIFLLREFSDRIKDRVLSYGELISSQLLTSYLLSEGIDTIWVDARELVKTDSHFTKANVDFTVTNQNIKTFFENSRHQLYIVPGFIASDSKNNTTTLGRGGSDYTAAIFGAAIDVSGVQIWTDVSGMMTADPRMVSNAKAIPQISYQEAMELSHFGAKVIYPPTIQPVMNKGIPVWVKNTFSPQDQ